MGGSGWQGGRALQHGHSLGGKPVLQGKKLGRCFYWFKCVFPQSVLQLTGIPRGTSVEPLLRPKPLWMGPAWLHGRVFPTSPALLATGASSAADLGEMWLPLGKSYGFKVGNLKWRGGKEDLCGENQNRLLRGRGASLKIGNISLNVITACH